MIGERIAASRPAPSPSLTKPYISFCKLGYHSNLQLECRLHIVRNTRGLREQGF